LLNYDVQKLKHEWSQTSLGFALLIQTELAGESEIDGELLTVGSCSQTKIGLLVTLHRENVVTAENKRSQQIFEGITTASHGLPLVIGITNGTKVYTIQEDQAFIFYRDFVVVGD
jgi:hypothetical protein